MDRQIWKLEYEALKLYHHLNSTYATTRVERIRQKAWLRWRRRVRRAFGCSTHRFHTASHPGRLPA